MTEPEALSSYPFLGSGSETGELIRAYDWQKT